MTPGELTVQPDWFNVVNREEWVENLPVLCYCGRFPPGFPRDWFTFRIRNEFVVLNFHDVIVVSEVNLDLLSAADLLIACYLHLPADHHLVSRIRRDLAFHVEHETFSGFHRRNMNLKKILDTNYDD